MRIVLTTAISLLLLASTAQAQLVSDPLSGDMYHVIQMEDRVLRIDRRTGDVSECEENDRGWVCRLSADDRLAYESEINRLDAEVERLTAELDALRSGEVTPGTMQDELGDEALSLAPDAESDDIRERLNLPSNEELDAVMDTAEEVMRRFVGMVATIREDVEAQRAQ